MIRYGSSFIILWDTEGTQYLDIITVKIISVTNQLKQNFLWQKHIGKRREKID